MPKVKTKRYLITIPNYLYDLCRQIKDDSWEYPSVSAFIVEATRRAVSARLGEGVIQDGLRTLRHPPVVVDQAVFAGGPDRRPELPQATEHEKKHPGRRPVLEWRDGAIRNAQGEEFMVLYAPPQIEHEGDMHYFDRIKGVPGVEFCKKAIFYPPKSPLDSPLVTDGVNHPVTSR